MTSNNSIKRTEFETSGEYSEDPLSFRASDGGERYLKEGMMLPPLGPMSGTKYYVNLHPTESDFSSSVNSPGEWDCLDYDDIEHHSQRSPSSDLKSDAPKTIFHYNKSCTITEEMKLERKLNFKNKEDEQRHKLITELEKQMLSLYTIKKQYKRTVDRERCRQDTARGPAPARRSDDKLSRQRDLIVERIRKTKIEEDKRKEKQIERKISIIKRLLAEQRERGVNTYLNAKFSKTLSSSTKRNQLREKEHNEVSLINVSTDENSSGAMARDGDQNLPPEIILEELKTEPEITEYKQPTEEQADIIGQVTIERDSPKTSKKKDKKKKLTITTEKSLKKKDKKKKKQSNDIEDHAAICEETPELPTSQMKDLLLWCENWRDTHDEDIGWQRYIDAQQLPVEENVVLKPTSLIFKDVVPGRVYRQRAEVLNTGQAPLQCRVSAPTAPDTLLQLRAELEGPSKARRGQHWTLTVTLEALEDVEDTSPCVWLELCREGRRTRLGVVVEVEGVTSHACPALATKCIRIGRQGWWAETPVTKYLKVNNPGNMACVLRWEEVCPATGNDTSFDKYSSSSSTFLNGADDAVDTARALVDLAVDRVFRVFSIEGRQGTELAAHSTVSLPIRFRPGMAVDKGDVFTKYKVTFDGERVINSEQELVVSGHVEGSPLTLEPAVLDLRVCYVGGSVAQGVARVSNSGRYSTAVSTLVPRPLAHCVQVRPRETVVQAQSSFSFAVRIVLSWNFLDRPSSHLDRSSGLLSVPILLTPHGPLSAPPLELTVVCLVAPPCPLSLSPSLLALGQVSTQETVSATFTLTNHLALPYSFAFVNLPQSVLIEPGGGVGTILPNECLRLRLLYCPGGADPGVRCGQPGRQADINIIIRCFTTISLASPIENKNDTYAVNLKSDEVEYTVRSVSSGYSGEAISTDHSSINNLSNNDTNSHSRRDPDKSSTESLGDGKVSADFTSRELENDDALRTSIHTLVESVSNSDKSDDEELWDYYTSFNLKSDNMGSDSDGVEDTKVFSNSEEHANVNIDSTAKFVKFASDTKLFPETHGVLKYSDSEEVPAASQRCASLVLQATVVDPLVELSAQAVVLTPTPCDSHSIAHVYLRCRPHKRCSVHRRILTFTSKFEFQSPWEHLQVEPRTGCIRYKEKIKVALIFKPTLLQEKIYEKALETKVECLKMAKVQELLEQYYKAKEKKTAKKTSFKDKRSVGKESTAGRSTVKEKATLKLAKTNKTSKATVISSKGKKNTLSIKGMPLKKKDSGPLPEVTIDPATVVVTEDDLRSAKMTLLKYLEAETRTVTVKCRLDTQLSEGSDERRVETLELRVECRTAPPALAPVTSTCLQFGPTALGTRSKLRAQLTNISFFDTPIVLSTLNPVGLFSCTAALERPLRMFKDEITLPPEHILTVPILFHPNEEGKVMERFEVRSGTCLLQLQAQGEGVVPSFTFSPDQEVFNMACAAGKKADVNISIFNTCLASLPFNLKQVFIKKGTALPADTATSPESESSKRKVKPLKQKQFKAQKQFDSMTPELMTHIYSFFVEVDEKTMMEPVFKLMNINKTFDVLPEESKSFVIRFTPPQPSEHPGTKVSLASKTITPDANKDKFEDLFVDKKTTPNKSVKEKLKSGKDRHNKNKAKKKSELIEGGDRVKSDYNVYAIKYELYIANVTKVKECIVLATVKGK